MASPPPDISTLSLGPGADPTPSTYNAATSPALTPQSAPENVGWAPVLKLDLSLSAALKELVGWLVDPLGGYYDSEILALLREALSVRLEALYRRTWDESNKHHGTGSRSLICSKELGLPKVLRAAAQQAAVDERLWRLALGTRTDAVNDSARDDWQVWCDPGIVTVRYGAWDYDDQVFDPVRAFRGPVQTIWQARTPLLAPEANTPSRPSHAIAIRAPTVFAIPPTPAAAEAGATMVPPPRVPSPSLLPAVALSRNHSSSEEVRLTDSRRATPSPDMSYNDPAFSDDEKQSRGFSAALPSDAIKSHRRSATGSTSSVTSSVSDSNSGASQLLTPAARSPASDPFALPDAKTTPNSAGTAGTTGTVRGRTPSPGATPAPTPTVTPYDGGNVTVLGGGVKLGGGGSSRASSVISSSRAPLDRSRSPSISLASRALNTALGPNANGARKVRTRRRIMPTYLGPNGQPGVAGPFGPFAGKIQPGGQPGATVHPFHGMMGMRMGLAPRMA